MERTVEREGVALAVVEDGPADGVGVVLAHGLTASRRYVVMGSRALERSGHRVIAYDARGHGRSSPGADYNYPELAADLEAVLDDAGLERAVLAGASMGAHTILRLTLERPERVAALVIVTPAHDPEHFEASDRLARWDALAAGLRERGVEGFLEAYGEPAVGERWRETVIQVIRRRLAEHEHLAAVADALEQVPRSAPFARLEEMAAVSAPTVVVASRDAADPGHPYELGVRYAEAIPGARLVSEPPGAAPLAWQGSQLSRVIAEAAAEARG
jgi:pimeloyl-ACP methyl ester carboxylesterase